MTVQRVSCFRFVVVASLAFSFFGPGVSAATDKKGTAAAPSATSKVREAAPAEVPKSVFNAREGRNPFFPARVQTIVQDTTGGKAPPPRKGVDQLILNGIVPPPCEKPTAMINGRTFEQGETGEVKLTDGTKLEITCEEIRIDSVIISLAGVKHVLTLRFGA